MSNYIDVNKFVFCKGSLEGTNNVTLTGKGADKINRISDDFDSNIYVYEDLVVHVDCRKDHSRLPTNKQAGNLLGRVVHKSRSRFDFRDLCLFCATPAKSNDKKRIDVSKVLTLEFQDSIMKTCATRNDEWGCSVHGRIEYVQDLRAADAVYHHECSTNFRTGKQVCTPPFIWYIMLEPNKTSF